MITQWRFDQGREQYHVFDNIVEISKVLVELEGVDPRSTPCPIRNHFKSSDPTWSFPPDRPNYTAWRNYARTFSLLLLAPCGREVETIEPTDICREIALGPGGNIPTFDDYLSFLFGHWAYPHPAFEEYDPNAMVTFPLLCILKLLASKIQRGQEGSLSMDEIGELLIGNAVTGLEPLSDYDSLAQTTYVLEGDEKRQLRELLNFIAQGTCLNWSDQRLYLVIGAKEVIDLINQIKTDDFVLRASRREQLLAIASLPPATKAIFPPSNPMRSLPQEEEFAEGSSVRQFHLRLERNPKLRSDFLESLPRPLTCDFCSKSMDKIYPWSEDFIEVHHLLPLASAVRIGKTSTSFSDLAPLCPNCHRAVHYAYSEYLKKCDKEDFDDAEEAMACYNDTKKWYAHIESVTNDQSGMPFGLVPDSLLWRLLWKP